ncbi:sensor histidine kinase [Helicobacter aurati]|uniref:histidine kinase n=1 Tax=Helicobacter aurati TaxID=137778 RepID=A0A3D8J8I7_9HELI|nr:HAMP domain-containing sensor histidine kinase [Helicobacter aurati]RDU73426.1 sensor histidine kinase [Helicobacter aurati]
MFFDLKNFCLPQYQKKKKHPSTFLIRNSDNQQRSDDEDIKKIQLLSTISHEIKNPLAIIRASVETLQKLDTKIAPSMQQDLLHRVLFYTKKITTLLDKLNLTDRFTHNSIIVTMQRFDVFVFCKEVIADVRTHVLQIDYQEKQIILRGIHREIIADRILLEQMLSNLIFNALKYANYKVTVSITEEYIEVLDDGYGMDDEEIPMITQKFYQGKNAVCNKHSLGLGLFIVQQIAKIHSTKVQFFSKRNNEEGLCVQFFI